MTTDRDRKGHDMTAPILLPPLPEPDFALDQGDEPCYYAHTLRARELEVARLVLESAAKECDKQADGVVAAPVYCARAIRNLEVKHHE
jgi:hypothetical protein